MSKSKVKKKEDILLPGKFTSVLTQEFVVATQTEGYDQQKNKLPMDSILKKCTCKTINQLVFLLNCIHAWLASEININFILYFYLILCISILHSVSVI